MQHFQEMLYKYEMVLIGLNNQNLLSLGKYIHDMYVYSQGQYFVLRVHATIIR